ncbi:MAG: hypothetical protein RIA71_07205 [Oceanicaulis sp.]
MKFRTSASLAVLAAALTLAACGGDGEPGEARSGQSASQGAADSGVEALAALGLAEPGRASWGERVQDGDSYIFTDFVLTTDEGVLNAQMLTLTDPRMSEQGPVFERLSVNSGEIAYENGEAGFDSFTISEAGPGVGQALANLFNGEGGFDDIALEQQTFASLRLEALRVLTRVESEGASELAIASIGANGFDGEVLESFSLADFAYDAAGPDGNETAITLDAIEASGVAAALLQSGMAGDVGQNSMLGAATSSYDQYDRVAVNGLNVVSGGLRVTMADFAAEVDERRNGNFVSTAAMPSLTLAASSQSGQGAGVAQALSMLGYEAMAFSFASETEYDPDADRVTTTGENYLAMEDGFLMSFEQDVSGVQAYTEAMSAWMAETSAAEGEAPPASVLEPLMIHSGRVVLEDRSLLDRALTAMAEQQGTTPAQLRSQAGMFVAMGAAMAGDAIPAPLMTELAAALTSFVGQGGAIIVAFEPEEPVSAARFAGEGGPDLSGITVRHEPAE